VLEVARSVAWLIFLADLLEPLTKETQSDCRWNWRWIALLGFGMALLVIKFSASLGLSTELPLDVAILGHVGLAIAGLALIEHLLRNTHPQRRWATKFLYLGLGSMFAYDFFLYSDTLLFKQTDLTIWEARPHHLGSARFR